jgi:hypothetical protein
VSADQRFWTHRLRWRMRAGSWLWPAFGLAVLVDASILHFLPPVGTEQQINAPEGLNLVGDVIVAGFANLFLVAVIAPWLARRMATHGAEGGAIAEPYDVHLGRMAAGAMVVGALGLIVVGLANRPVIVSETEATETNARLVQQWIDNHGNAEMRRNLETANTVRLSASFFRTCIANDERSRYWCFFVDTKVDPPKLVRDPDSRPNSIVAPAG